MNWRVWENPWRLMLAVNAAVLIGVFWHKITLPPYVPYIHLLVDYHFGFTKRALIGAIVSLFTAKVPVWLVFALSGAVWLITAGLFVKLFRRTFGFNEKHLPLFVFMAGSPLFLKNFMHTLGHFDIYGCLFAICLLLIPARSLFYVGLSACSSLPRSSTGRWRCPRQISQVTCEAGWPIRHVPTCWASLTSGTSRS